LLSLGRGPCGEANSASCSEGCITALTEGLVEDNGSGGRDVEGAYATGHGNSQEMVAGAADELVEPCTFAAKHQHAVAGEIELVVVGLTAFVEADDPKVLLLQVLKSANEVDDAGDAKVFGGTGAGFHGDRAERGGTAFSENHSVDARAVGYAEEGAEILRIFNAIEREQQAGGGLCRRRCGVEVFDGEGLLRPHIGDHSLVSGGSSNLGELVAAFLANADAR